VLLISLQRRLMPALNTPAGIQACSMEMMLPSTRLPCPSPAPGRRANHSCLFRYVHYCLSIIICPTQFPLHLLAKDVEEILLQLMYICLEHCMCPNETTYKTSTSGCNELSSVSASSLHTPAR